MILRHQFRQAAARCAFLAVITAIASTSLAAQDAPAELVPETVARPTAVERIIARYAADLLGRHHYAQRRVDNEISELWYERYFEQLDHGRAFFLQSDIEEFKTFSQILDDLVLRDGNIEVAYDIYDRYLMRVRQWIEYCRERLAEEEPFDFTREEEILLDRSEEEWCATMDELKEVWRRRLKNTVLVRRLAEEAIEEEAADEDPADAADGDENNGDEEAAPTSVRDSKSIEERILASLDRFYRRKAEARPVDVLETFMTGLSRSYDPHSAYMAPDTEEDFDISMRLKLQGIGAVLTTNEAYVEVVRVIPGGPAMRDGRLKSGDRIVAVAQEGDEVPTDVVDMPLRSVVRLIRGEKGTRVFLTVLASGTNTETLIDIVRDEVQLSEQKAQQEAHRVPLPEDLMPATTAAADEPVAPTLGRMLVISLPSFYFECAKKDIAAILEDHAGEDIDGVILDLRSDGGGSLDEAIHLAGLFVDGGPVVQVRQSNGDVTRREDTHKGTMYDGPLVVMVDKASASASEIVAACLQDYRRAVIVGDRSTHGKGTVQTVFPLNRRLKRSRPFRDADAGSLKFTMAKFYRVNGGSTQVKGVQPDIVLPAFTDHMEIGEANLPGVLPWDEIDAPDYEITVDVTPYLDVLRQRSESRAQADPDLQKRTKDIAAFGERRKRKTVPLNYAARKTLQKEEKHWAEILRASAVRHGEPDEDDEDEEEHQDPVLQEGLRILADLAVLRDNGDAVPVPGQVQTGGTVAPDGLAVPVPEPEPN